MASSSVSTATHLLLRNLFLRRPLRLSAAAYTTSLSLLRHHHSPNLSSSKPPTRYLSLSSSLPQNAAVSTPEAATEPAEIKETETEAEELEENENGDDVESSKSRSGKIIAGFVREDKEVPNLSVKEKKELGSYANGLGDKLKCQQVGKSGVTDNVIFALNETLEKRELLKLKIQKSCPGELEDVVSQVQRGTGSVAVFQIGRIVIFYRPSITKMKAEEKKEQNRKLFAQKKKNFQTAFMMNRREQVKRPGQGYRGSRNLERSPS